MERPQDGAQPPRCNSLRRCCLPPAAAAAAHLLLRLAISHPRTLPARSSREPPAPLVLPEVTPATRLLAKRRQQFEADEKLEAAKAAYAAQVLWLLLLWVDGCWLARFMARDATQPATAGKRILESFLECYF